MCTNYLLLAGAAVNPNRADVEVQFDQLDCSIAGELRDHQESGNDVAGRPVVT